jgi:hypothetical protein
MIAELLPFELLKLWLLVLLVVVVLVVSIGVLFYQSSSVDQCGGSFGVSFAKILDVSPRVCFVFLCTHP